MTSRSKSQVNIRSTFVRERAAQLAAQTGKSITQVVEDAVRAYRPAPLPEDEQLPDGFEIRNGFVVQTGRKTSIEEILAAIEESRDPSSPERASR